MSYELMKSETASEISGSKKFMDAVIAVSGLKQLVPRIRVVDDKTKAVAAETRAQVHQWKKDLEDMRKSAKGPYLEMGKVVAAMCHAPALLIEAGAVKGRDVTSYLSIRTDMTNAGGRWVDHQVAAAQGIITSRHPADLDAFIAEIAEQVEKSPHPRTS